MSGQSDRNEPQARVRPSHVAFVASILVYAVWYIVDAIETVESIESAMAVIVCATLAVFLGLVILVREFLGLSGAPPERQIDDAESEPLANPVLLAAVTAAYVLLIILIGLEIPTFLFLATTARLLGSRSLLFIGFYSAAITGFLVWMVHFFATPPDAVFRIFG